MATTLDPRCKMLYGVPDDEHEKLWQAMTVAAAGIAKNTPAAPWRGSGTVSSIWINARRDWSWDIYPSCFQTILQRLL